MSESSEQIPSSLETASGLPTDTPDHDSRPIGRCHAEYLAVKAAFAALNAAMENLRVVVAALGDCRADAAKNAAGLVPNQTAFDAATGTEISCIDEALGRLMLVVESEEQKATE